jgi:CAI-1 autoinducer synthase
MDLHYITASTSCWAASIACLAAVPAGAVILAGNDYLCMAGEPALVAAQIRVLQGGGAMLMSAVYLQEGSRQHRLEQRWPSFWAAKPASWRSPAGPPTWACCNAGRAGHPGLPRHAGARLAVGGVQSAQAVPVAFLHNDGAFAAQLDKPRPRPDRRRCAVQHQRQRGAAAQMVEIAERSGCMLIVDESHSLGTHGRRARGWWRSWAWPSGCTSARRRWPRRLRAGPG